jgi:hypothetical protein
MKKPRSSGAMQRKAQKAADRRRAVAARKHAGQLSNSDLARASAVAASSPLARCLIGDGAFETGVAQLVVAREVSSARLALGIFLVDVWCLGVKDSFYRELSPDEMDDFIAHADEAGTPLVDIEPECARRIVAGAVDYAAGFGFAPQGEYAVAMAMFGDIDGGECGEPYVFGKDGKPNYVQGPNDSPTKVRRIMATLERTAGAGNYDFLLVADERF